MKILVANEKNNRLNNLQSIHKIQKDGAIQELLRDLRSSKNQLEMLLKNTSRLKTQKSEERQEEKPQEQKIVEEVKVVMPEPIKTAKISEEVSKEESAEFRNAFARPRNNSMQNRDNRQFNGERRQFNRSFNNDRNQNGRPQFNRPFQNNGQNSGNFRQFNNVQRPYNNQNNQQRPFGQRNPNGFASSKANAFKSFAQPLEDSRVLAAPEKTFGGKKAPVKSQYNEKKQMSKKALVRRGFIVEDSYNEDLDGERMGSRKLVKAKKKAEVFVAPAVENAVIPNTYSFVGKYSLEISSKRLPIVSKSSLEFAYWV